MGAKALEEALDYAEWCNEFESHLHWVAVTLAAEVRKLRKEMEISDAST